MQLSAEGRLCKRSNEYIQDIKAALGKFPAYPVHIIFNSNEASYRVMPVRSVHWWWDRRALLKQASVNEFSPDHWVAINTSPSSLKTNNYLLIGIRPSETVRNLISQLRYLSNPVSGVQLWTVVLAQKIFQEIRASEKATYLSGGVIILYKYSPATWQIIACHNEAIVLFRQGRITHDLSPNILHKEIETTLRYLNRNDYPKNETVTVIQAGFSEKHLIDSTVLSNVIHLKQNFSDTERTLKYFTAWYKINKQSSQQQLETSPSFVPEELRSHYSAFYYPQLIIRIGLPLSLLFLALSIGVFIYNNYTQRQYSDLLEQKLQNTVRHDTAAKLKEMEFFKIYREIFTSDPMPLLQKISKVLPPYGVAKELAWVVNAPDQKAKVTINLIVNRNLLDTHNVIKGDSNVYLYQAKVKKALYKFNPLIKLDWHKADQDKSNGQQRVSVTLDYPLK
jgi:hypothetical protein